MGRGSGWRQKSVNCTKTKCFECLSARVLVNVSKGGEGENEQGSVRFALMEMMNDTLLPNPAGVDGGGGL